MNQGRVVCLLALWGFAGCGSEQPIQVQVPEPIRQLQLTGETVFVRALLQEGSGLEEPRTVELEIVNNEVSHTFKNLTEGVYDVTLTYYLERALELPLLDQKFEMISVRPGTTASTAELTSRTDSALHDCDVDGVNNLQEILTSSDPLGEMRVPLDDAVLQNSLDIGTEQPAFLEWTPDGRLVAAWHQDSLYVRIFDVAANTFVDLDPCPREFEIVGLMSTGGPEPDVLVATQDIAGPESLVLMLPLDPALQSGCANFGTATQLMDTSAPQPVAIDDSGNYFALTFTMAGTAPPDIVRGGFTSAANWGAEASALGTEICGDTGTGPVYQLLSNLHVSNGSLYVVAPISTDGCVNQTVALLKFTPMGAGGGTYAFEVLDETFPTLPTDEYYVVSSSTGTPHAVFVASYNELRVFPDFIVNTTWTLGAEPGDRVVPVPVTNNNIVIATRDAAEPLGTPTSWRLRSYNGVGGQALFNQARTVESSFLGTPVFSMVDGQGLVAVTGHSPVFESPAAMGLMVFDAVTGQQELLYRAAEAPNATVSPGTTANGLTAASGEHVAYVQSVSGVGGTVPEVVVVNISPPGTSTAPPVVAACAPSGEFPP